jgi:hypothetical protein
MILSGFAKFRFLIWIFFAWFVAVDFFSCTSFDGLYKLLGYESWSCTSFLYHAQQIDSRKSKKKINFSKNMHNIWFSVKSPINFNKPIHLTFYTFFICSLINYKNKKKSERRKFIIERSQDVLSHKIPIKMNKNIVKRQSKIKFKFNNQKRSIIFQ